uniref:Uncharacterized protein n=1 Tax=Anguilla anguilla TaxID=7936 RepID=A0A0E9P735_ANGAN
MNGNRELQQEIARSLKKLVRVTLYRPGLGYGYSHFVIHVEWVEIMHF